MAYKIEGGQYVKKYIASFVGFAPVSNPRLVVAVMIDEPGAGRYYGGDVAGPVFSGIMGSALRTLGIPPDAPLDTPEKPVLRTAGVEKSNTPVRVAGRSGKNISSPAKESL